MKNYTLFICYFLIINVNASPNPFAAFLVDDHTQQEIVSRVLPMTDPLVAEALARLPHPKAYSLRADHATLDVHPKILDFSLEEDDEDAHSLTAFHVSLSLKNISSPRSLRTKLGRAAHLLPHCPMRTIGAKKMGRGLF